MFGLIFKKIRFAERSPGWSKIRKQYLKNNPNCAACGRNKKLEVHHIVPVHLDPSRELDIENLITLCDDPCHFVFGHLMDYQSWNEEIISDCEKYLKKVRTRP